MTSKTIAIMDSNCWTPQMRDDFIKQAVSSKGERGSNGHYWYNVMPKNNKPDEENPKKASVTHVLMETIFSKPQYRIIALKIYDILIQRITTNPFTRFHYQKNVVVLLKGGTAYTYALGYASEIFPYSDLDLMICINPFLSEETFSALQRTINIIVLQTISQYKRAIDTMFFTNKENATIEQKKRYAAEQFLSDEEISQFKADYSEALAEMNEDEGYDGTFVAPFDSIEVRNASSKHSFIIAASQSHEDSVVRIEVPHFEMCERIPLRKTPLVCSHNRTLNFNRSSNQNEYMKGCFDLYRLRLNNLFVPDEQKDDNRTFRESIVADFIDISIPRRDDVELHDFWSKGRTTLIKDEPTGYWIAIPCVEMMVDDLHKMLQVYECPDSKKEKRKRRYEALLELSMALANPSTA